MSQQPNKSRVTMAQDETKGTKPGATPTELTPRPMRSTPGQPLPPPSYNPSSASSSHTQPDQQAVPHNQERSPGDITGAGVHHSSPSRGSAPGFAPHGARQPTPHPNPSSSGHMVSPFQPVGHARAPRRDIETHEFPRIPQRGSAPQQPTDSVMRWPPPAPAGSPLQPMHHGHGRPTSQPPPTYVPSSGEATMIARTEATRQAIENQQEQPYLIVMAGNMAGQIFSLDTERTLLGRSPDCEVSLFDIDISRIHAEIRKHSNGQMVLSDFNSTNGTYLNGKQISQSELRDGDRVQLGCSTILKFSFHSEIEEMYQRRLYENAVLDGLTQIYNRKFFEERLSTELSFAQRHQSSLSLLMIDIDHFKSVNDTHGHLAGDQVLRYVAQSIKDLLRKEDIVARYGGEEFAVIARGIQPTQAAILGERIRSTVEMLEVPTNNGNMIRTTSSIGVVTMGNNQFTSPQQLVHEADMRLYQAKRMGRNRVVAESV
ncbi:MAG: diguanylate cyclase [Deltaproteobacteria bacterium]|nr:MAG: diguanylate cyclase [Deltaproteobacteria bacterium]